jgi:plastocyanin
MLSNFKIALITLLTLGSFRLVQAADVIISLDGQNLNYSSSEDIYGFQFDHDGCASGASGGDAASSGFFVQASPTVVLGVSLTGSFIASGSGALVELGGDCASESLSGFVFSGIGGIALESEFDDSASSADYTVNLLDMSFDPSSLDIEIGETVEWVWVSGAHNVNGSQASFPNNPEYFESEFGTGLTYSYTFNIAGRYDYQCDPHASMGMVGSITVGSGGCDDESANNYDANADFDNGTCTYDPVVSTLSVAYSSDTDIYGFQFDYLGEGALVNASGGAAGDAGFTVSSGGVNNTVIGFSFSGAFIPAGSGVLTVLEVEGQTGCIADVIISGLGGSSLNTTSDCVSITVLAPDAPGCTDSLACNYDEDANINDGSCEYPSGCDNVCGSTAVEDCAGECGGSAEDLGCGCDAAGPSGCDNVCGSTAVEDCAGVCGGSAEDLGCGCDAAGP